MSKIAAGLAIIASASALTACDVSGDAAAKSAIDNLAPNWSTLDDGSKFAMVNDAERDRQIAMRCWPESDGSHLCLSVVENRAALGVTTVYRSVETSLPPMLWGLGGDGYRCDSLLGGREEVAIGDDRLIANQLRNTQKPWSRSFVEGYMAENKINAPGYFRCLDVLKAVTEGSPRTLATTSVWRELAS